MKYQQRKCSVFTRGGFAIFLLFSIFFNSTLAEVLNNCPGSFCEAPPVEYKIERPYLDFDNLIVGHSTIKEVFSRYGSVSPLNAGRDRRHERYYCYRSILSDKSDYVAIFGTDAYNDFTLLNSIDLSIVADDSEFIGQCKETKSLISGNKSGMKLSMKLQEFINSDYPLVNLNGDVLYRKTFYIENNLYHSVDMFVAFNDDVLQRLHVMSLAEVYE